MNYSIATALKEITGNNGIKFKQFDEVDWLTFSGAESPSLTIEPYVSVPTVNQPLIIVDRNGISVYSSNGDWATLNCEFYAGLILALNIPEKDFKLTVLRLKYGFELN